MKKTTKWLLIWAAALVLLVGAAAGVYFLLRTTDDALTEQELSKKGGTWLIAQFDKGYGEHAYKVADVSRETVNLPEGYKQSEGCRRALADLDGSKDANAQVFGKKHGLVYDLIAVDTVPSEKVPSSAKTVEMTGQTVSLWYEDSEDRRTAAIYMDSFYEEVKIRVRVILTDEVSAEEPEQETEEELVRRLIGKLSAQMPEQMDAEKKAQLEGILLGQLAAQPTEETADETTDASAEEAVSEPDTEMLAMLEKMIGNITINPGIKLHPLVRDFRANFIDDDRYLFLWNGLLVTLEITIFAVLLGILIGVIVATVRSTWDQNRDTMHKGLGKTLLSIGNKICEVYLTVIRGTPVVIQLMIMYFIVFASSRNSRFIAILAFGINSGAYVAEIIRGGIMSIDHGQLEAGRSLGFNYVQTMGYIIIPQALKNVLPALANEFIVLLKETSVVGYVAEIDLTKGGDIIRGTTHSAFMPLLAVAAIYLVMVMFFTWLVGKLERRLRNSDH